MSSNLFVYFILDKHNYFVYFAINKPKGLKMNMPKDWSNLSQTQINMLLLHLLWNLKKYSVQEEADTVFNSGKYRINGNVTIECEYTELFVPFSDNGGRTWHNQTSYESSSYNINGKSLSCARILPRMLYEKCEKRCR